VCIYYRIESPFSATALEQEMFLEGRGSISSLQHVVFKKFLTQFDNESHAMQVNKIIHVSEH